MAGVALGIGSGPVADLRTLSAYVQNASRVGFSLVTAGDNATLGRDVYAKLTCMALSAATCRIGALVTNPMTRSPLVTASAASTIHELALGGCVLGIGGGYAGRASRSALERYVMALRELWDHGEAVYEDVTLRLEWDAPAVPLFVTASGPVGLRQAGRIADGVVVEVGLNAEVVQRARALIAEGARDASRDPDELEVWWYARGAIGAEVDEQLDSVLAGVATSVARALGGDPDAKWVPESLRADVEAVAHGYDPAAHVMLGRDSPNARLLTDRPALLGYALDRFALIGSPDEWVRRLGELEANGVERVFLPGLFREPAAAVDLIGREVLPRIAR